MKVALAILAEGLITKVDAFKQLAKFGLETYLIGHDSATSPLRYAASLDAVWQQAVDWLLLLYPWEVPDFDQHALCELVLDLPEDIQRVGLRIEGFGLWRWSPRLLRHGQVWQSEATAEALCDDLILKQTAFWPDTQTLAMIQPDLQIAEQALIQAVDAALRDWNQTEASRLLSLGLAQFPHSPALSFLRSGLLSAAGNYADCRLALDELSQASPDGPWSWPQLLDQPDNLDHLYALLDFWSGDPEASLKRLASLGIQATPAQAHHVIAVLQQSPALIQSGQLEAAQAVLSEALNSYSKLPLALQTLASRFVIVQPDLPELGCLDCHHLDLITLHRLYPDQLQGMLGFALARCQLLAGQPDAARKSLSSGLANPMSSPGKLMAVLGEFQAFLASGLAGDVVELGCNQGSTSLLLQTLLQAHPTDSSAPKSFHVYDSFEGLPAPRPEDGATPYDAGSCLTSRELFEARFARYHMPLPQIHPGWFSQTLPNLLPARIGFAYLDGDFYSSIHESLTAIYDRLETGAWVLIDDYGARLLPGAKAATDEFLADKPEQVSQLFSHGAEAVGLFKKSLKPI